MRSVPVAPTERKNTVIETIDIMKDTDLMPFGCHKGRMMQHVPPEYLDWLSTQSWLKGKYSRVFGYIERCRQAIDDELEERGVIPHRRRTLSDRVTR